MVCHRLQKRHPFWRARHSRRRECPGQRCPSEQRTRQIGQTCSQCQRLRPLLCLPLILISDCHEHQKVHIRWVAGVAAIGHHLVGAELVGGRHGWHFCQCAVWFEQRIAPKHRRLLSAFAAKSRSWCSRCWSPPVRLPRMWPGAGW